MTRPRSRFVPMRVLPTPETQDSLSLAALPSPKRQHERLAWLVLIGLPLAAMLACGSFPALNHSLEHPWFHFQIVSLVSLVAFVLGITTFVLLEDVPDARAFFIPLGLGGIAGVFFLHGLATPDILVFPPPHSEHNTAVSLFARPDLAVAWSAPVSLLIGACFFGLASREWSEIAIAKLVSKRRFVLGALAVLYVVYVVCAVTWPAPFEWGNQFLPVTRYALAVSAGALYVLAAWKFWKRYRASQQSLDAALAFAAVLLAEALIPLVLMPLWSAGWWLYHILMLVAFCVALGAVLREYERKRHFELSTYFTAVSVIATALLALVAGDLVTRLVTGLVPPLALNQVRWGTTIVFLALAALLIAALWLVVRRGDNLLRANSVRLQQQQAEIERARLAARLAPIGVAIGESLDLERVLGLICRESHALFQVNTALIWFKQGNELIARAAYGQDSAAYLGMRQPVRNNPLLGARVVREERPIYVNHAATSGGVNRDLINRFGIQSILGVPLFGEKQVIGALVLIDNVKAERFGPADLDVAQLFAQQAAHALTHARLYEKIQAQTRALIDALSEIRTGYNQTLAALSAALDARDHEIEGHSRRVAAYALLLADALHVQDQEMREAIEWGALLHDVGKIGVPDAILHKRSALSDQEWVVMKQHPEIGYQILQNISYLKPAFAIVRYHHERWDGTGYPFGLRGTEIPLPARIFALADTLDAITTERPYRRAQAFEPAFQEITRMSGTQFDPQIVQAFMTISQEAWKKAAA